jgi:hypothetical protein
MKKITLLFLIAASISGYSQKQAAHWFFGIDTHVDFNTSPPTVDTTCGFAVGQGYDTGSSMSDSDGNLLFYTNSEEVHDRTHQLMQNGSGLLGNRYCLGNSVILKKPGSQSIYYIFTAGFEYPYVSYAGSRGLRYSVVDMTLNGGLGALVSKNVILFLNSTSRVAAVRHCNGNDFWVIATEPVNSNQNPYNSQQFKAFHVSSAGVNPVAVTTTLSPQLGPYYVHGTGDLKVSPTGKKIATDIWYGYANTSAFLMADFDNASGSIQNQVILKYYSAGAWHTGGEFSPDGSKLYHSMGNGYGNIYQWNLCAGSPSAIIASCDSVLAPVGNYGMMQTAPDGKIYVAPDWYGTHLGIIHNPNLQIQQASFVHQGLAVPSGSIAYTLNNFVSSYFKYVPAFTYTDISIQTCHTASFSLPPSMNPVCNAVNSPYTGQLWIFGDAASGAANTSTLASPYHNYPAAGNYTVKLVYYTSCYADTSSRVVHVGANLAIIGSTATCNGLGSATVTASGNGPYNYLWLPSGQTSTIATQLTPGTHTLQLAYNSQACISSHTIAVAPVQVSCAISYSSACEGGTATVNVNGGSGVYAYLWSNTHTSSTLPFTTPGNYTVQVFDAVNGCGVSAVAQLTMPATPNLQVSPSITACIGEHLQINASGAPICIWHPGQISAQSINVGVSANIVYTVTGSDPTMQCASVKNVSVNAIECNAVSVGLLMPVRSLYPVPANSHVLIQGCASANMTLLDACGRAIMSQKLHSESEIIQLTEYEVGFYVAVISFPSHDTTKFRVVKLSD